MLLFLLFSPLNKFTFWSFRFTLLLLFIFESFISECLSFITPRFDGLSRLLGLRSLLFGDPNDLAMPK